MKQYVKVKGDSRSFSRNINIKTGRFKCLLEEERLYLLCNIGELEEKVNLIFDCLSYILYS